ncbi:hypothetical protein ANCCAN_24917 [Ancylostoma caninum]|uniref:Protein kinase domain-containing protein n=1 Tax=Ancylostoma caninum TaxID=29170 RepID=A0A368FCI9_ANCCA|nr:hypothetical protein ANCCAN_24917 [Ancylostoma caninum]
MWHKGFATMRRISLIVVIMCVARRPLLSLCEYFGFYTGQSEYYNSAEEKNSRARDLKDLGTLFKEIMAMGDFVSGEDSMEQLTSFVQTCDSAKIIDELVQHPYFNNNTIVFESDESFDERHLAVQQKDTRLMKDFIIQKYLGRGAFGDVVQARSVCFFSVPNRLYEMYNV